MNFRIIVNKSEEIREEMAMVMVPSQCLTGRTEEDFRTAGPQMGFKPDTSSV
jgi:hypothetical protein